AVLGWRRRAPMTLHRWVSAADRGVFAECCPCPGKGAARSQASQDHLAYAPTVGLSVSDDRSRRGGDGIGVLLAAPPGAHAPTPKMKPAAERAATAETAQVEFASPPVEERVPPARAAPAVPPEVGTLTRRIHQFLAHRDEMPLYEVEWRHRDVGGPSCGRCGRDRNR